jgi:hypothetical protein
MMPNEAVEKPAFGASATERVGAALMCASFFAFAYAPREWVAVPAAFTYVPYP